MIAALPMYDWPEIREHTAMFWGALRDGFRGVGMEAPDTLTNAPDDLWALWRDPALVLSQTCGLPYAARLSGDVSLIGAPAYDLPGVPTGSYLSEIVVRADDPAVDLAALHGARFAYNMRESQSGYAAFASAFGAPEQMFAMLVQTGAHRASIQAVAEGRADVAAIDGVSWQLALRHEPAAGTLRVLTRTPPTPGLPLITAKRSADELSLMRLVIQSEIGGLPPDTQNALLLHDLVRKWPEDYAPLAAGWP